MLVINNKIIIVTKAHRLIFSGARKVVAFLEVGGEGWIGGGI